MKLNEKNELILQVAELLRQMIPVDEITYMRSGAGERGKILVFKSTLLKYLGETS